MNRKLFYAVVTVIIMLCFSGCGSQTAADMYSLPKRSPEYNNLQTEMDRAMMNLEYAAPVSGENRQSVQLADLDGDGVDEYLVFARGAGEKPLKILVFRQLPEQQFELLEAISCKGAVFEQIEYVEFDDEPGCELVVGRQINDQVTKIASVYSFASGQSEQILSSIYTKFITCDLNRDGSAELMVIRSGEAEAANAVALLYSFQNGAVERSIEASLSVKADQIRRITTNVLYEGETAVYVASSLNDTGIITDIFAVRDGQFSNITLSSEFGTSVQTWRNYYIYAEDINGDGILELPSLIPMQFTSPMSEFAEQNLIRWYCMDINGEEIDRLYTYHNYAEGWYIELDQTWLTRIAVEEFGAAHTFYMWNENYGEALAVFTVYTLTGRDRDSQADVQNRFALHRGENVVYAGKLEYASALYGISESYLINCFHLIRPDRLAGDT